MYNRATTSRRKWRQRAKVKWRKSGRECSVRIKDGLWPLDAVEGRIYRVAAARAVTHDTPRSR